MYAFEPEKSLRLVYETFYLAIQSNILDFFLVPMLPRGNAYRMGSHAGAWEPGNPYMFWSLNIEIWDLFVI